jgi:hypothetical protein
MRETTGLLIHKIQGSCYTCCPGLLRKAVASEMEREWSPKGSELRSESNVGRTSGAIGGRCNGAQ